MSTAITERPTAALVSPEQLELVKRTVANGATPDELKLYLYDCARQGVHPLDKLLHFTKRGGKYTPVTSIDLMRVRAAETGEYAGSDDAVFTLGDERITAPHTATVTVWRLVQGQRCQFTATARWAEYYPGDQAGAIWRKMPHTMLAKCAEALALRKGFPRQLAGLYAKEELDQAGESQGYSVSAPVTSPTAPALPEGAARRDVSPSVPNGGDSGHSHAPDVTRPPTGGSAPPAGYYRILQVQKQTGKVKGEVILVDHHGQEQKLPAFQDQLVALAERLCQDGVSVEADIKVAGTSQKPYLKNLRAALPESTELYSDPLTNDDIPFMWLLPLIGPAFGLLALSRSLLS